MKNQAKAFKWIVKILKKHTVPFQVTGGLAAKIYGSQRELNDIDIAIPEKSFADILSDVKGYLVFGPERFVDENWDLSLMTLRYQDQEIDICGGDTIKIRNSKTKKLIDHPTDFPKFEIKEIYGVSVPVVKKEKLIDYKKILGRSADMEDVKAISKIRLIRGDK
ncbi:MAG: hypothetical protein LiPW39_399 [Parcubacteria group bacterium LiPW_39]|nr:MAG: hypothetical protein LiPW39_399 [Parcubacteria group bacterium LiPW_39]